MPITQNRLGRYFVTVGGVAFAYFLMAKLTVTALGLQNEVVKASPVWMPSGIAVAALLLLGRRVWSGIAIGAFLTALSLSLSFPIPISLGIATSSACGATLQALAATFLLRRVGFRPSLERLQDALWLIGMGAMLSPLVSATISTFVPLLLGAIDASDLFSNWWTTWVGDGMGVLVLTPILLTWQSWLPLLRRQQIPELLIWLVLLVGTSGLIFGSQTVTKVAYYPLEYLPFPLIIWAALRFGLQVSVFASFTISTIAIWGAANNGGPFVGKGASLSQVVLLLQTFMGVITMTALVLAAAVAERQQTENLLRRSEASLVNAQRIAQIGNWDLDLVHYQSLPTKPTTQELWKCPLRWSDELYRILGFVPRSFMPNQEIYLRAVHPNDRERVKQAFQAAVFEGKPYSLEYRIVLPDGDECLVSEQVEVSKFSVTGTVQNVTERRQSEAALRESERRCRGIFEGSAIGIGLDSLDGRILESNPALQTMLGYSNAELSSMKFSQFTHPDDAAADEELFQEMIAGVRDHYQIEKRHLRKDGKQLWVRLTNSLVRNAAGDPQFTIAMVEDVTDLKRAEESTRLYANIVKTMQIGVVVWHLEDLDDITTFRVVDLNPAAAEFLQIHTDLHALKGQRLVEAFPDMFTTECLELFADVVRHQTDRDLGEVRHADAAIDGFFAIKAFPLPNHCVGFAFENVTERRKAEEALQQSEARFRVVAEAAACAILVYQGEKFRYINPATEAITGYSREELLAMSFWDTVHPDFRDVVRERGLARQRGEVVPPRYELKVVTKSGEERWIDYTAAPVLFEGQAAALGTGFDITERKQAEAQLQLAARRDRLLTEISHRIRQSLDLDEILKTTVEEIRHFLQADRVFISHFDRDGYGQVVAESVDEQWRSLLGWTSDANVSQEIRTMFAANRIRVNNDSSKVPLTPLLAEYYERCQVQAGIGAAIMQDNHLFGLLIINQCSAPRQWQPFEVELLEQLAIQVEIAIKQSQLYQQVQNFAAQMEYQVQERTMQLQQKMEELQKVNQFQDILLHAVSHDLRTPIIGMQMILKHLQNKPGNQLMMQRSRLEQMLQSGERQLMLINSLLEDRNQEGTNIQIHCEPHQLEALVSSVIADLEPVLQSNQVVLNNLVPTDLTSVYIDAMQIRRVYDNLITNALKHNPPGIQLTLQATYETIAPNSDSDSTQPNSQQAFIRCTVEDNGVGINPEQCNCLFKLYPRGVHNPRLTGIGLGLYMCRQIIHAHGGEIGVTSNPSEGATFWFTLPVWKQQNRL
jgi:PAS domain S-box-containing protein